MIGFLMGVATKFMWLGFLVVEAFIFKVAWNLWLPYFNELEVIAYKLPEIHLSFWGAFGFFVIIYYIGKAIQMIVPNIVKISSESDSSNTDK